jgi:hypothetical protein
LLKAKFREEMDSATPSVNFGVGYEGSRSLTNPKFALVSLEAFLRGDSTKTQCTSSVS